MRAAPEAYAIVGIGCRYPDAPDPDRLWELVLSRRRAFRHIPDVRLDPAGYVSDDAGDPDRTYARFAAVLEGWEFDRARFKVPGAAYRSTDLTHWLALEVAADTLASAGFPGGRGLDTARTGVVLGNTLTGEFSRSSLMRLRWPYVRRVVGEGLAAEGWDAPAAAAFLDRLEKTYKAPFPEPTDESLAGGLANTIAGRVCNHFDLNGGGYTVDGACSSSLLAIVTACTALREGDLDLVLAGGVDLSLDPFELVGFARTGALATSAMRIYDADPTGFWPGEGCGMVALMRADDALASGRTPLALIRGWGVSSDGQGGITRPERKGQLLAIGRAYERAGFGPETVAMFEGHGTGTAVGDEVEIASLIDAQRGRRDLPPAALGSVKANIGHTKAAAGIAGLLKATLALQRQVIPPTTGCDDPHPLLRGSRVPLRVAAEAEPWPDAPLRAAVSAMGFGGINTHVVLESVAPRRRRALSPVERRTARRPLGHEVFAFSGETVGELASVLDRTAAVAAAMSFAEHADLAAALAARHTGEPVTGFRLAVVAGDPGQLARRARQASRLLPDLERAAPGAVLTAPGVYASHGAPGRVGLLFTGQGAPVPAGPGALATVLPGAESYFRAGADGAEGPVDTAVAQPAIFSASMAGLRWLSELGVDADAAAGHSLGEIGALCWAGSFTETEALGLVGFRGEVMSKSGAPGTGMVSIAASREVVAGLIDATDLVVSADNGASQVVGGRVADLERVLELAAAKGVPATRLAVSHAFHTAAVTAAEEPLSTYLAVLPVSAPQRTVFSTVSGRLLTSACDLRRMLAQQVTAPVLFRQAVEALAEQSALLVEVGPGRGLASLAASITDVPAVAMDVGARSAEGLCQATAALFAAGAAADLRPLFAERLTRPFDLWRDPRFLANPCEAAVTPEAPAERDAGTAEQGDDGDAGASSTVRLLVARAVELPADAVGLDDRLLSDLHLNSLRVAQLATEAATACGRMIPAAPLSFGDARVGELASTIDALPPAGDDAGAEGPVPPGVADWHRVLVPVLTPVELPEDAPERYTWDVRGSGPMRRAVEPLLPRGETATQAIAVFLPEDPGDADIDELVCGAREAMMSGAPLAVVDQGDTASGFLGTLRQEYPGHPVRSVRASSPTAAISVAHLLRTSSFAHQDVVIDRRGRTAVESQRPLPLKRDQPFPIGGDDVVLVTGGGKGIGFETATALAALAGARLGLLGRSTPDRDEELRANLDHLAASGARFHYASADVADPGAVRRAVAEITRALGPVTAVVHSSGINNPGRFADLDGAAFAEHAAPKYHGLRAVLDALERRRLRAVVSYGSVIGRFGLKGEAHYALANGRMRELMRVLARDLPGAFVCNVDWTAWSGAGMGHRLQVLDSLVRAGVVPIPADLGVRLLAGLLATGVPASSVLATGRLPDLSTHAAGPALQAGASGTATPPDPTVDAAEPSGAAHGRRFLERIVTHTPGVELVAEAGLGGAADAYLDDHRIDGLRVLPAVAALEAMAQAGAALTGRRATAIRDGRFDRPVVVPEDGTRVVRVCALVREDGDVDVVLRSDESGFAVDHFACRLAATAPAPPDVPAREAPVPAHEGRRLYGPLFFHGPPYQRLRHYDHLEATGCTAVLTGDDGSMMGDAGSVMGDAGSVMGDAGSVIGNAGSVMGDAGSVIGNAGSVMGVAGSAAPSGGGTAAREGAALAGHAADAVLAGQLGDVYRNDASIHVLQACVPHRRLLPVGCDRLTVHGAAAPGPLTLAAVERAHTGADYTYDVVVRDSGGRPVVSWQGLRLRDVGPLDGVRSLPPLLLGPYLQRVAGGLLPGAALRVAVADGGARTAGRGGDGHAPGGRPLPSGGSAWSRTRLDGMVITVSGPAGATIACDAEPVPARDDLDGVRPLIPWPGQAAELARLTGEPEAHVLARLWTVQECLSKTGRTAHGPLTVRGAFEQGWVLLRAGADDVVSAVVDVDGRPSPVAVAVLASPAREAAPRPNGAARRDPARAQAHPPPGDAYRAPAFPVEVAR
ncbi:type I polyketide synthase [Sphaerisporangium sp. TRM90804]|uniref:type I polyketide synthase n=1 Tax=Sphaerisporangium sp. TRM90804 TaxID=3031113 RepID=UPI00244C363E|nr:type I polyketide synthase [Sphaerisporangium sp. TRM90804]MDH2429182.1 SDR family NAD(P)-dependent oxidoreductase [Sphaerisporangium sp. TRM90804]